MNLNKYKIGSDTNYLSDSLKAGGKLDDLSRKIDILGGQISAGLSNNNLFFEKQNIEQKLNNLGDKDTGLNYQIDSLKNTLKHIDEPKIDLTKPNKDFFERLNPNSDLFIPNSQEAITPSAKTKAIENEDVESKSGEAKPAGAAGGGAGGGGDDGGNDNDNEKSLIKQKLEDFIPRITIDDHEGDEHDGHTLKKHRGHTKEWLEDRIKTEPNISGATSFPDTETANRYIRETLNKNIDNIITWLSNNERDTESFIARFAESVGYGFNRDGQYFDSIQKVFVLLQRTSEYDFKIVTAYPLIR